MPSTWPTRIRFAGLARLFRDALERRAAQRCRRRLDRPDVATPATSAKPPAARTAIATGTAMPAELRAGREAGTHRPADSQLSRPRPHHAPTSIRWIGRGRSPPELDPSYYGFTDADYDRVFSPARRGASKQRTLREILWWLRNTYCRTIGVQFMHIDDPVVREWLQDRMEETREPHRAQPQGAAANPRAADRRASCSRRSCETKFTGAKSFSLEGAESLIPLLDLAIEQAGERRRRGNRAGHGAPRPAERAGQRHRQEPARDLPRVPGSRIAAAAPGRGDVKYHLGYSSDWTTAGGAEGPPVAVLQSQPPGIRQSGGAGPHAGQAGSLRRHAAPARPGDSDPRRRGVRRRGRRAGDAQPERAARLPRRRHAARHRQQSDRLHDDARTKRGRASTATDVAKMLQIPIFHVNGEDPEAVAQVRAAGARLPQGVPARRGHRHVLLPPARAQRRRRAVVHAAAAVQDDRASKARCAKAISSDLLTLKRRDARGGRRRSKPNAARSLEKEFAAARSKDYQLSNPTPTGIWADYHGGPGGRCRRRRHGRRARERVEALLETQTQIPGRFPSASEARARARATSRNGGRQAAARLVGRRSRGAWRRSPTRASAFA